jgi:hypothetical protein
MLDISKEFKKYGILRHNVPLNDVFFGGNSTIFYKGSQDKYKTSAENVLLIHILYVFNNHSTHIIISYKYAIKYIASNYFA